MTDIHPLFRNPVRSLRAKISFLLLALLMAGCASLVPIQLMRFPQFESYIIHLRPSDVAPNSSKKERAKRTTRLFHALIGEDNYDRLVTLEVMSRIKELDEGRIYIRGHSTIIFSPARPLRKGMLMEGSGRFYVVGGEGASEKIFLSGDSLIEPKRVSVDELCESRLLPVKIKFIVDDLFGEPPYYHEGSAVVDTKLIDRGEDKCIGYAPKGEHPVLVDLPGDPKSMEKIGTLSFSFAGDEEAAEISPETKCVQVCDS